MDGCNWSVKKLFYMKESMAQADPSKEVSTGKKKMNDPLLLLSSNKTTLKNGQL